MAAFVPVSNVLTFRLRRRSYSRIVSGLNQESPILWHTFIGPNANLKSLVRADFARHCL